MSVQKDLFGEIGSPKTEIASSIIQALPDKLLFRPDEVASIFEVTAKTVYQWCALGIIPSIKVGGVVRIKRSTLISLMESERDITLE